MVSLRRRSEEHPCPPSERQRERQTDRQTDRQRERERQRETDISIRLFIVIMHLVLLIYIMQVYTILLYCHVTD